VFGSTACTLELHDYKEFSTAARASLQWEEHKDVTRDHIRRPLIDRLRVARCRVCAGVSLQAARLAGLERQYNKDLKDLLDEAAT
jgi:hypothetical protein